MRREGGREGGREGETVVLISFAFATYTLMC